MDWQQIATLFVGVLVREIAERYFDKKTSAKVLATARDILESADDATTNPREAAERALVIAHHRAVIEPAVEKLQAQVATNEIRVRGAIERGKALTEGADISIVPRDGTEAFQ